jgi:hypothetical protein
MSEGTSLQLARVLETVAGTTPATPTFQILRVAPTIDLKSGRGSFVSQELIGGGQVTDHRLGIPKPEVSFKGELSYGSWDTDFEALVGGTWTENVLKCTNTTVRRAFTFEEKQEDWLEAAYPYERHRGCMYNTCSMTFPQDGIISLQWGLLGMSVITAGTAIASPTYTARSTTTPFGTFVGSLTVGGSSASITDLEISLDRGGSHATQLFSSTCLEPSLPSKSVKGKCTFFLESRAMVNDFNAETEHAMAVTMTDPANNTLLITLPRVKFTGIDKKVDASRRMLALDFESLYDSGTSSNFTMTRTPHV